MFLNKYYCTLFTVKETNTMFCLAMESKGAKEYLNSDIYVLPDQ